MNKIKSEAWVLELNSNNEANLVKKEIQFDDILEDEVLVKPLYGCLEGNMIHALTLDPINIFNKREEKEIILGNAGVVEILKIGENVKGFEEGDKCIYFCNGEQDEYGYPKKITAYDKPKSLGVMAKTIKLNANEIIKIPRRSKFSLQQWAAFSLKYITAWSNWKVAYACWKSQMSDVKPSETYVVGWGGGVSYAEITLAKLFGCKCYSIASKDKMISLLEQQGITCIDRRKMAKCDLEKNIVEFVKKETDGKGASIFLDNIGVEVFKITTRCLGRQGIVATSGWKTGSNLNVSRAYETTKRHIHVFTHYAKYEEGEEAINFAIDNNWIPPITDKEHSWEDIPNVFEVYGENKKDSYFLIFKIN